MYATKIIIKKANATYNKKNVRILDIDGSMNSPLILNIFLREL
jgi:hypothetical protein